ncbi:Protein kinase of the Mitotic Exit Network [Coemansia erecta]|uniref:Protein kinase of the Mitotic Exit Network n=1 Tax=Coemansia erecta TaxID=147472 RepID=A0A9W8CSX0_9FUNG|nr:Protein kinase of the Mitotic Exit Network [Coemansia erecta]
MSVKQAPAGTHFGDFQPEELLGQLKAEQQTRNYDIAAQFIEAVLGIQLDALTLKDSLRDGVVLCKLINALRPGAIKRINTRSLPFTQMENIGNFLAAAKKLGLKSTDLFQTVDLYEGKNMPRVIMTLLTIARVVAGIPLNSQKRLADAQRTLGGGWNAGTLTAWTNSFVKASSAEYASMRNQPTLVSSDRANTGKTALAASDSVAKVSRLPAGGTSVLPKSRPAHESRSRRRQSKRRSAATLFIPSPVKKNHSPAIGSTPNNEPLDLSYSDSRDAHGPPTCDLADQQHLDITNNIPIASPSSEITLRPRSPVHQGGESSNSSLVSGHKVPAKISDEPAVVPSKSSDNESTNTHSDTDQVAAAPPPRRRNNTRNRPKERLTVYSENDQRLTNYQLGNCIGRGQFGSVYRALDLETGQMVAVKQIPLSDQNAEDMDDVMQEVELLKSLSSSRIVRYYGFVKTDTQLNLVMEFVENGSLSATLKSFGVFPEKLVLAYAIKIIEGLIYLHGRDVVHCDLKACNILTTKKGNTKLTDFGVSLNLKLRKPDDESVVAGTPYWMAPEIIQLEGACMASDIWSLGCTIIELLTGKPPYSELMQMQALYRIVEDEHPPIPEGISEELKDFLLQCFRKDPKARPTASELMAHSWTAQYGRNRQELRMLRRTCSRKMSSFMARSKHSGSQDEYPTFDAAKLNFGRLPTLAEATGSDGADQDHDQDRSQDQVSEAEAEAAVDESNDEDAIDTPVSAPVMVADSPNMDLLSAVSGEDTDASISTFEGPRLKQHRLRTILGDGKGVCVCAVCSKSLSGAFIQCSSCKTRCHDACTRRLEPCLAMRMSRFHCPASRKSSKRYETRTPVLRLRRHRKSTARSQANSAVAVPSSSSHAPYVSASLADLIGGTCGSHMGSLIGSSDGSLFLGTSSKTGLSILHDGFDGVIGDTQSGRPVSLAVTMGLSAALAQAESQAALQGLPQPRSIGRRFGADACDSGWETDDTGDHLAASDHTTPSTATAASGSPPAVKPVYSQTQIQALPHPSVSNIRIPTERQQVGPYSAPLQAGTPPTIGGLPRAATHQQPLYYQALSAGGAGQKPAVRSNAPLPPQLAPLARPRSIRRQRANTASLDGLAGSAPASTSDWPDRNALSTLLRRRQHPLRGATSSDFKAVAGFSPGAAQRAKRGLHGSSASISDLQSCTASGEFVFGADTDDGSGCWSSAKPAVAASSKRGITRRAGKDCIVM